MEIIQRRKVEFVTVHQLNFDITPGSGWSFDCDATGSIDRAALNPAALENLLLCETGEVRGTKVGKGYVNTFEVRHTESAIGKCDCGEEVVLSGFTNTCDKCGADYNGSGQQLAPREQWGEETSEDLSDILSIP